nr:hypothetical protein [Tanacetum cinerariifolium]
MVAILEKGEHNIEFHPMVDFIEASPLRIETAKEGTKILATVDGIVRTVSESSLRRNLKLRDEEGISTLPDAELFENLTLMGYNIYPNLKFTFQKGKFSHQWKYLIHTIMQCLSPKSIGFKEFSSNIATALVCLATNRNYNFSKMIFDGLVKNVNNKVSKFLMYLRFLTMCLRMSQFGKITHTQTYVIPFHTKKLFTTLRVNSPSFSDRIVPLFDAMLVQQGEGSGTPTEPHHTPSPEAQPPSHTAHSSSSLSPVTTTSIPTVTPSDTTPIRQYTRRIRIAQSSVPPTVADELASPQRDVSQGEACPTDSGFIADQDRATINKSSTLPHDSAPRVTSPVAVEGTQEVEINRLKERVKLLEEREGAAATKSRDDAPIKGMSMDEGEAATERVSDDTEEMATVLTSMDAATVLASGVVDVPTGSGSIPTASTPAKGHQRTGRTTEEREDQRRAEQIAKDAEIARIHAKEELQIWKQMEDFIPTGSKEETKRIKRKGINLEQESAKKQKTLEEVTKEAKSPEEVPEEKVKEMMQLVPIEEVEDLNQLWRLVKETLSNRPPISDKEMELWLYDSCGVHHVTSKDKEIFMLVEKDYPLRKGLALVMICYKLQVDNFLHMGRIVENKMHKAFPLRIIKFPLAEEVPTASVEGCHCQKKSKATARKIALLC